jgi:hypothetical protein
MWLVKLEFVPAEGARERTRDDLREIGEALQRRFAPERVAAYGGADRFVVFAHKQSASSSAAEAWARQVLAGAVSDYLSDWRLNQVEI